MLVALIRKNCFSDGAIGLLPKLLRILSAIRSPYTSEWLEGAVGFWDAVVVENSCLREGLLRVFRDEAADIENLEGYCHASALWDMKGFYDALDPVIVLERASEMAFLR